MILDLISQPWFQAAAVGLLTILLLGYLEILHAPWTPSDLHLIHNSVPPPRVDCVGWCGDNDGHLFIDYRPAKSPYNLLKLVLDRCPSLNGSNPFIPSAWLGNTHLQTMFGPSNLADIPVIQYAREFVPLSDGGQVSLDWYPGLPGEGAGSGLEEDSPTVLILHGMGGGKYYFDSCPRVKYTPGSS